MIHSTAPDSRSYRICLILEGTRPFASDGISTWASQIVRSMPDIEFFIHYSGDRKENTVRQIDQLPDNVVAVTTSYLVGMHDPAQSKPGHGSRSQKDTFFDLVRVFVQTPEMPVRLDALCRAAVILRDQPGMLTLADLLNGSTARHLFTEYYQLHAPDVPFLRYHAGIRPLATTLWELLHAATALPDTDIYHGTCNGHVGLLGAIAAQLHKVPLLLSDPGSSLQERIDHLRRSPSLAPPPGLTAPFQGELGASRSLPIGFLDLLSGIACNHATHLTSVCGGQARDLIDLGARADRITVVPHGIDTGRFSDIAQDKLQGGPPADGRVTVGFLGRIVPAKDVKTLLRAARLVLRTHPETRFILSGSTTAAPDYFAECLALADQLGISQSVEFPGRLELDDFLVRSDIVVLTSISGGAPFALLQASAAGLPVVAANVGACREMIVDQLPGHPTLGPSGIITEVADPASTANALNQLIASADLRFEHGINGLRRVQSAHRQKDAIMPLHRLYLSLLASNPSPRTHAVL